MKMSVIISFLMLFTFACKSDSNPIETAKNNSEVTTNVMEKAPTKDVTATPEKEAEEMVKEKEEVEESVEDIVTEKKTEKVTSKTATKSVPKPEKKEVVKVLEKVELKTKTETKDKSIPKSEIKETTKVIENVDVPKVEKKVELISHDKFNALLSKYVSSAGNVNYAGLKQDNGKLQVYLDELAATQVSSLSKNEKLAFWINAYNAFTLKLIVDNYPINSITDLEGGKPWDKKWIKLNGKTLSLNNIENDIIRPEFKEPRIHFAVNCAAKSCPPLLNKAWTAANLESNFEKQTKKFVNNAQYNTIGTNSVQISKIFDWYGVDFGNITAFLNKYSSTKIAEGTEIKFQDYNWALNK